MTDSFKERGSSFENKYAHDAEFKFKATARRNKLLGLWAGGLIGLDDATAAVYAKQVVMADFEKPGDGDVIHKVLSDLKEAGHEVTEKELIKKMDELLQQAAAELTAEAGSE